MLGLRLFDAGDVEAEDPPVRVSEDIGGETDGDPPSGSEGVA